VAAAPAAPTATPARNLRRSTLAWESSRDMIAPFRLIDLAAFNAPLQR
jgi:hypothetical protein